MSAEAGTASSIAAERPASRVRAQRTVHHVVSGTRDLRIDFIRGLAMLFVVVDHVEIPSYYHALSHERIGAVSGAELFVTMSGLVLGIVYRRRADAEGWAGIPSRLLRRARVLYLTSLVVMVTVYALSFVPGVRGETLTTYTDPSSGVRYPLYGTTPQLLDYPIPVPAVRDVVLLNVGPWQFNIISFYVIVLLLSPLMLRLLVARRGIVLSALSLVSYVIFQVHETRLLPSQYEDPFPLLAWQLLVVHGLIAGYHWHALTAWSARGWGRLTAALSVPLAIGFMFFTSNTPWLGSSYDYRLSVIPADTFTSVYERFFLREPLGVGRVANTVVLIVAMFVVLSLSWPVVSRTLGWFLVPIGQASLYVFFLHVYLVLLVANVGVLNQGNVLVNTVGHTALLGIVWLMVRYKVLYRWIPR